MREDPDLAQPGASSRPPDTADAIRHRDSPTTPGHLAPAPTAIASTDATASANRDPAAAAGTGSTPTPTSKTVKNTRTASARAANRRSHPRTVSPARPKRTAIGRHPTPNALATSAAPITSTASALLASTDTDNSTCVTPQPEHRPRRGRSSTDPVSPRTTRVLAQPHPANTPGHLGHPTRPAANAASTSTTESPTVTTSASKRPHGPPDNAGKQGGRAVSMNSSWSRWRRRQEMTRRERPAQESSHPVAPSHRYVVTSGDG